MGKTLNEDIKCPHCGESIEADVEQKKYKQLYDRYNQCRDAELDRFWKNSVFVWVFLALCFTAIGTLFINFKMPKQNTNIKIDENDYNLILLIISIIGLFLSNIWVWMARGLKAWYEVFENVIWDMETNKNVFNYPKGYTIDNYWEVKNTKNIFQSIFVSPASISTSKIVILIGRLLVLLWISIFTYSSWGYSKCGFPWDEKYTDVNWLFICIWTIVVFAIFSCRYLVSSSTLTYREDKDLKQFIITKLNDNLAKLSQKNKIHYYLLKNSIKEENISINGNRFFRRVIINTRLSKSEHGALTTNQKIDNFASDIIEYINEVVCEKSENKYYKIRKVKQMHCSDTIIFKIKCHISLAYIMKKILRHIFID